MNNTMLAHFREVALRIAPELAAEPLYVIDGNKTVGVDRGGCLMGWAVPASRFHYGLIPAIGEQYIGPGNVVTINFNAILAASKPGGAELAARGIFLHEVAHVLPATKPIFSREEFAPPAERIERYQANFTALLSAPRDAAIDAIHHNSRFYHRTAHLIVRAEKIGFDAHPTDAGGHLLADCLPLIAEQATAMHAKPFSEIDAAIPDALVATFDAEARRKIEQAELWKNYHTQRK